MAYRGGYTKVNESSSNSAATLSSSIYVFSFQYHSHNLTPHLKLFLQSARRSIESKLFSGKLLGVTATSALELGIDVGDIGMDVNLFCYCECFFRNLGLVNKFSSDATLHLGFPGSISSFWQQAGRAGRGMQESLAIMVLIKLLSLFYNCLFLPPHILRTEIFFFLWPCLPVHSFLDFAPNYPFRFYFKIRFRIIFSVYQMNCFVNHQNLSLLTAVMNWF